jgi:polysaccharide pyruvyl transferase WcaK-like protein
VGVVGFFGHGNYGDELFLEVYREHLGGAFALRSLLDPGGGVASRLGDGVRRSDALVIGGGDIVIPWSAASRYWERTYLRRPVFIAGVGVPMWRQPVPHVVDRLRSFFTDPAVRFVGSRDEESTGWIAEHLRPSAPLVTAPDLVCALTLPAAERPTDPPIFGVAVRSRNGPDDLSHVRALCQRAASMGYRVRRIILATGKVRARDLEATAGLELPDTELVSTDDLDAISRAIGECSAFATMKFHGVIVATMYGVPSIALMPTTKTKNFLRGIDRLDLLSAYSNPELPSWLDRDLAPIAPETVERLRSGGVAHLADLRSRIEATIGS